MYVPNYSRPSQGQIIVKYAQQIWRHRLKRYFYSMNILRLAGELLLIYILYKLIFDFIIPIYQTTRQVKKQFGEMNSRMQEQMNTYNQQQSASASKPAGEPKRNEEYIDYEEIK